MQQVKDGLSYLIESHSQVLANEVFIEHTPDAIRLSFHFTGVDCGVNTTLPALSNVLIVSFNRDYLKSLSVDADIHFNFPETLKQEICCTTQMLLFDVLKTNYQGVYKHIYLESKFLELLLCTYKCYEKHNEPCENCKFLNNEIEKDKILTAKDILLIRMDNPPTIPELSKEVGINQCYLKKGFKEMFNTTIYDYVQEQRMLKAKLLLSSNNYSVSAVAELVGYSSPSSFSAAFKKHTGVLPSDLVSN